MPDGTLSFDERGIAVDGTLTGNGVELDLRMIGMLAVLVSREAILPRAPDDDDAVRAAVLDGLRWRRRRWMLVVAWIVSLIVVALIVVVL